MATVVMQRRREPTRHRRMRLRPVRDVATAVVDLVSQCRPYRKIGIRRRSGPYLSGIRWAPLPLELERMGQRMVLLLHRHPLAMPRMAVAEIGSSSSREDVAAVANGIVAAAVEPGEGEAEADMMGVGAMAVAETGSSREAAEAGAEEVVTDGATTPAEVDMTVVEQVEGGVLKVEAEVTGTKEVVVDG